MISIKYPEQKPLVKIENGIEVIFCSVRKRWLLITPEEWVRQNFILYLVQVMKYPATMISVEKKIMVGEMEKRYDLVIYSRAMKPFMVIECKEMKVPLSQATLTQVLNYNAHLQAQYLIITNGSYSSGYSIKKNIFREINEFPEYASFMGNQD